MVAQFRATHDLWAGDPAFTSLLERLQQGSPEFTAWWTTHDVRNIAGGRKQLDHPKGASCGMSTRASRPTMIPD